MIIRTTFILATLALVLTSCGERIKGNGNVVSRNHDVESFNRLKIAGVYQIELIEGNKPLEIVADENLHEHIEVRIEDETLIIGSKGKYLDSEELLVRIFCKDLREVDISGAAELKTVDPIDSKSFELQVSGACDGHLDLNVDALTVDISGGSELDLSGKADRVHLQISGAGEVRALALQTKEVDLDISGAGEVEIDVKEALDVRVAGAGEVRYTGNPKVSQQISGAGDVKHVEEI